MRDRPVQAPLKLIQLLLPRMRDDRRRLNNDRSSIVYSRMRGSTVTIRLSESLGLFTACADRPGIFGTKQEVSLFTACGDRPPSLCFLRLLCRFTRMRIDPDDPFPVAPIRLPRMRGSTSSRTRRYRNRCVTRMRGSTGGNEEMTRSAKVYPACLDRPERPLHRVAPRLFTPHAGST